jgi:hypothetical protein
MGHALAAEPGTEARPPITEAVRVDGVLTDWFRERLATPADDAPAETSRASGNTDAPPAEPVDAENGAWSLDSGGDPPEARETAEPWSAGAGSGR